MSFTTQTPSVRLPRRGYTLLRFGGILLLGLLLLGARAVRAQNAPPAWTLAVGARPDPVLSGRILATALDADGNVFVAGEVDFKMQLGSIVLAPPYTNGDCFVAKYNPATGFVWAVSFASSSVDVATSLAVRGHDVYVGGYFQGAALAFGTATLTKTAGISNGFVGKLTDNGASAGFGWVRGLGGADGLDRVLALAVSGTDGVLAAGAFSSTTAAFGPLTLANVGFPYPSNNAFVAKLTDAGATATYAWAQRMAGPRSEALAVATQGTGVVVAGYSSGVTADFGTLPPVPVPNGSGYESGFVTRLADAGSSSNFAWGRLVGGSSLGGECRVYAVALSGTNVYVAGHFDGYQAPFGTTIITSAGSNGFVAKLADAGSSATFGWATKLGGTDNYVFGLGTQGRAVYMAGVCVGTAQFGLISLPPVGPATSRDLYVARLTDAGPSAAFDWVQHAGGSALLQKSLSLAVGGGHIYAGSYANSNGTLQFGSFGVSGSGVLYWPFLASLTDNGPLATVPNQAAALLSLWPNPAHGTATVRLPIGAETEPLLLLDGLGRTVRRFATPARGATDALLDLRGLPAGPYVLRGAGRAQHLAVE